MEFALTEEQQATRDAIRRLAEREFAPRAAALDKSGDFPWENIKALGRLGYLGMTIPPEYGGAGSDWVSMAICIEEIGRACASTAVIVEVHNSIHCEAIYRFGTEEQRQRYLPGLCNGERLGAFALTEPGAGSDPGSMTSTARREGESYVLNGTKCFITSGGQASQYIVMARTSPGEGKRGISAFIVESGTPGLSFGPPEDKLGVRASHTTDLVLEDARVPAANLLGREGEGLRLALSVLDGGRIGIAAQAVGIAQAALEASLRYARERVQFGRPIAEFQAIRWKLAEMATDIEAARLLTYRAADLLGAGCRASTEAAMAKLFASRMAVRHALEAIQIHGGYGYTREYPVERLLRDAKATEIYEGTSEIQRLVISAGILAAGVTGR